MAEQTAITKKSTRPPGALDWIADKAWMLGLVWLGILVVGAIAVPLSGADPNAFDYSLIAAPPSWEHPLGMDQLGRDIAVRIFYGASVSGLIGVSSVILGMTVGLALGLLGGYFSGIIRTITGLLTDTMLAFPVLVLVSALVAIRGATIETLVVGLSLGMLPTFTRLARANTMTFASRDFVTAATVMGARTSRLLLREVLPNILPPVMAYSVIVLGIAMIAEGALSFLGLGIQPPTPAWGSMIAQGRVAFTTAPHVVFVPAGVLFLTILSLNIVGERLSGGRKNRLHVPI